MKRIILLPLVIILTACSFRGSNEFSRNQEKWRLANITHYRYFLFVGCFCPFTETMPLSIEVKDGKTISTKFKDGTAVSPTDPGFETFSRYATIDRLFSELKTDLTGKTDKITVTYDLIYGFPQKISIDYIKLAMDDELSLVISGFEALP